MSYSVRQSMHDERRRHGNYFKSDMSYISAPNHILNDSLTMELNNTMSVLHDNADKIDIEIKTADLHEKIQLFSFCGCAKIATLRGHKWLFESISTSLIIYDNMTQEEYEEENIDYFGDVQIDSAINSKRIKSDNLNTNKDGQQRYKNDHFNTNKDIQRESNEINYFQTNSKPNFFGENANRDSFKSQIEKRESGNFLLPGHSQSNHSGPNVKINNTKGVEIDLLLDDVDNNVKRYKVLRLGRLAILRYVDDYHSVKLILERSIMIFYKTIRIDEKSYSNRVKSIIDWCEEHYEPFIDGAENELDKRNRNDLVVSQMHIDTDRSLQNFESLALGLKIFQIKSNDPNEKTNLDEDSAPLYNYHGGVNSNLLKQNKDLKEQIENFVFQLELKDDYLNQWTQKCWLKNREIDLKNDNLHKNSDSISLLITEIKKRDNDVVNYKNKLTFYENLHNLKKKEQLGLVDEIKETQNLEFDNINHSINDVKQLVENMNDVFIKTYQNIQTQLENLDEAVNHKKRNTESAILINLEECLNDDNYIEQTKSLLSDQQEKLNNKTENKIYQLPKTAKTCLDSDIDCLNYNYKYKEIREDLIKICKQFEFTESREITIEKDSDEIQYLLTKLSKSLIIETLNKKFYLKKRIKYYQYPIYGNSYVYFTGFVINDKPYGYGILRNIENFNIIYEGEFVHGKIHGENLQIFNKDGAKIYQGNMLKGKRHCKNSSGKLWFDNGQIKYEGGFDKDEYDGQDTTEYYENGVVYYSGGMRRGNRYDKGYENYTSGKIRYNGKWLDGNPHDSDAFEMLYEDGSLEYKGQMEKGRKAGFGKLAIKYMDDNSELTTLIYEGYLKEGIRSGYGKLYDRNMNLLYDGNWDEDKRNKQGKSYNKVDLNHELQANEVYIEYDGEWCNDLKWGYGTEHDDIGRKVYEGYFDKGIKSGKGTSFYTNIESSMQYNGDWVDNKKSGTGLLYHDNGQKKYEGQFKNDLMWGIGELFSSDGICIFKGEFESGVAYRSKIKQYKEGVYDGQYKNELRHGEGTMTFGDGTTYTGRWKNDEKSGAGKVHTKDGVLQYEGIWLNDYEEGHGTSYYEKKDAKKYEGNYVKGKPDGYGTYYYNHKENDNIYFQGYWKCGKPSGKGIEYKLDGNKKYEGQWENGNQSGYGTEYRSDNVRRYEGFWKNGKFNGRGTKFDMNNEKVCSGLWKDGKLVDYEISQSMIRDNWKVLKGASFGLSNKNFKGFYVGQVKEPDNLNNVPKAASGSLIHKHGRGILFDGYVNKIYEGEFKDNFISGEGIEFYENGRKKYEGKWSKNLWNGIGKRWDSNGNYIGQAVFKNGVVKDLVNKNSYLGKAKFKNGQLLDVFPAENLSSLANHFIKNIFTKDSFENATEKHGHLVDYVSTVPNTDTETYKILHFPHDEKRFQYVGEVKNDKMNGKGIIFDKYLRKYCEGYFKENYLHSNFSKTYWDNGNVEYEGGFFENRRDEFGIYYLKDGSKKYEGKWFNNLRDGKGISFYYDGISILYDGEWKKDVLHGEGKEFDIDGNIIKQGLFENGEVIIKSFI